MTDKKITFLSKESLTFHFFIKKLRNYEPEIVRKIADILGVPKFKMGDFFRTVTNIGGIKLNRECQVYHIDKIFRNFKQEVPIEKIRLNNYKYYYINRFSGRIGYMVNEDLMIPVEDEIIENPNKIDNNNLWI